MAEAVASRARAAGDKVGEAAARVVAAHTRSVSGAATVEELEAVARAALPLLEQAGDHAGLVHIWSALGYGVANPRGRMEDWAQASEQAIRNARLAGQRHSELFRLGSALVNGPRPADETLRTLEDALPEAPHRAG